MVSSLSFYRYSSFALFTLCNAVICCVSVWNLVLSQQVSITRFAAQVDAYLIAISAFGILYIFPVMFIDLLRKNALAGRVWFEGLWIGLFWILNLAGASAATATLPRMMCNFATAFLIPPACATSRVLIAFSWINTAILLAYFCLLMVSSILHMKEDSQIWSANTRTYPWFHLREALHSARPSPTMRTTWSKPPLPATTPQIRVSSDFGERMVSSTTKSSSLRSSTLRSAAMKSAAYRSSTYDSEKQQYQQQYQHQPTPNPMLSAVSRKTPMTANKSAKILQSAWISATVTPASPPSDDSYGSSPSGSDLTSTPTLSGLPPSAMYVPFSSTIKQTPLGTGGVPPRSSSLSATFKDGQPPLSALLTPSRKGSLRGMPSPKPPVAATQTAQVPRGKAKRKSNRPPPLDMTRLHSTYGR
ncbi:hypothetical protein C8Q74DRAFT_1227574 [Fomes fomentarius]|nr:hypothetical protein C8Q74DRAFT_1227574 [Fomes fomentarius]